MSEASAAMGLTSLEALSGIVGNNRRNHYAYARGLAPVPGLRLMERDPTRTHNFHYVVVEVDEAECGLTRDEIVAALRVENVVARRYFHPGCHRMEPYAGLFPQAGRNLPVTEAVASRVIVLPNGLAMTEEDVATLTARLGAIVRQAPAVRSALRQSQDPRLPAFGRGEPA
jgi:dTDP-4-amino-4,6-dideoxygalactose transaminase